jgi:ankyrin repeat protein
MNRVYNNVRVGNGTGLNNFLSTHNVNTPLGNNQRTLLMGAVSGGYLNIVRKVLQAGGRTNSKNKNGDTPLHYAVRNGSVNCIGFLIGHGAHIDARNNEGQTPLMLACKSGYLPMVIELLKYRANPRLRDNNNDNAITLTLKNRDPRGRIYIIQRLLQAGAKKNATNVINAKTNNANIQRLLFPNNSIVKYLANREIGERRRF